MSDKERISFGDWCDMKGILPTMGQVDAYVRELFAVECRAPAPQPPMDRLPLLVDAVQKFLKHDGGPGSEDYDASEIYHARRSMQAAFGFRCPRCGETLPHLYTLTASEWKVGCPQKQKREIYCRLAAADEVEVEDTSEQASPMLTLREHEGKKL